MKENKISIHHNDYSFISLVSPEDTPNYFMNVNANAAFRDIMLDKSLASEVSRIYIIRLSC